jgi:hypothetical protein
LLFLPPKPSVKPNSVRRTDPRSFQQDHDRPKPSPLGADGEDLAHGGASESKHRIQFCPAANSRPKLCVAQHIGDLPDTMIVQHNLLRQKE